MRLSFPTPFIGICITSIGLVGNLGDPLGAELVSPILQGWTTACSSIPERDGKDQGEDSPKQAGSCWFARHS